MPEGGTQPPWTAIALGGFALVQACFGVAVSAGWKPWVKQEQAPPTLTSTTSTPLAVAPSRGIAGGAPDSSQLAGEITELRDQNGQLLKEVTELKMTRSVNFVGLKLTDPTMTLSECKSQVTAALNAAGLQFYAAASATVFVTAGDTIGWAYCDIIDKALFVGGATARDASKAESMNNKIQAAVKPSIAS